MLQRKLVNISKDCVLAERIGVARTISERGVGLLNDVVPKSLFLKTRFGIHTFGMRFSIDCALLDSDFRVVKIKKNIVPGRFFFWNPRFSNIIELPAGTLDSTGTSIGDILALQDAL
ncbi:MAG: DUF192 domain-containing protein [bacterium]